MGTGKWRLCSYIMRQVVAKDTSEEKYGKRGAKHRFRDSGKMVVNQKKARKGSKDRGGI